MKIELDDFPNTYLGPENIAMWIKEGFAERRADGRLYAVNTCHEIIEIKELP